MSFTVSLARTSCTVITYALQDTAGNNTLPSGVTFIDLYGSGTGSSTYLYISSAYAYLFITGLSPGTTYNFKITGNNVSVEPGPVTTSSLSGPTSQTISPGGTATFTATVTGRDALSTTYQWLRNGVDIPSATTFIYYSDNTSSYQTSIPGQYSVRVTEILGVGGFESIITSNVATLTVASGDPACFLASAPVLTTKGYRPIITLNVGDEVITADKRVVAIRAIKYMTCEPGPRTNPYLIPKGMFGAKQDLMISPQHRVVTSGGEMVEARHLGLKQVEMKKTIAYYNLELPNWDTDNMIVAGVHVESLAPKRTVTVDNLMRLVRKQYGNVSATAMLRQHKILPNGTIEVRGTIRSVS